jgi:hypothetical protein
MDQIEVFRRHAVECRQMARAAKDRESRAAWNAMAERCLKHADLARKTATMAVRTAASRTRTRKMRQWSGSDAR